MSTFSSHLSYSDACLGMTPLYMVGSEDKVRAVGFECGELFDGVADEEPGSGHG